MRISRRFADMPTVSAPAPGLFAAGSLPVSIAALIRTDQERIPPVK